LAARKIKPCGQTLEAAELSPLATGIFYGEQPKETFIKIPSAAKLCPIKLSFLRAFSFFILAFVAKEKKCS